MVMQQTEVLSDEWTSETLRGYAINSVRYDPEMMATEECRGMVKEKIISCGG